MNMLINITTTSQKAAQMFADRISGGKALIWLIEHIPGRPRHRLYRYRCPGPGVMDVEL
jgi:hypothetical protein